MSAQVATILAETIVNKQKCVENQKTCASCYHRLEPLDRSPQSSLRNYLIYFESPDPCHSVVMICAARCNTRKEKCVAMPRNKNENDPRSTASTKEKRVTRGSVAWRMKSMPSIATPPVKSFPQDSPGYRVPDKKVLQRNLLTVTNVVLFYLEFCRLLLALSLCGLYKIFMMRFV